MNITIGWIIVAYIIGSIITRSIVKQSNKDNIKNAIGATISQLVADGYINIKMRDGDDGNGNFDLVKIVDVEPKSDS